MDTSRSPQRLVALIVALAQRAGAAVMKVYSQAEFATTYKESGSPLTAADVASHDLISEELGRITPSVPVLSEESKTVPYDVRRQWRTFWLVDPLDGTKEFIQRNGEFTVNIALIEEGRPVLGVVHAPALDATYFAVHGLGAFKQSTRSGTRLIGVRPYEPAGLKVVVSRSHPSDALRKLLDRIGPLECIAMGSSLKICVVAEGEADLYPRLGPTMEWDTAAAQCVVEVAGGTIMDLSGQSLRYNKPDLHNPDFVVSGSSGLSSRLYSQEEGFEFSNGDNHGARTRG